MARRAAQSVSAPTAGRSSKRTAPDKPTPTRQSKRTKVRSSYFEHGSDEDGTKSSPSQDAKNLGASDYEDNEGTSELPSSASEQEEASSEEETKPKRGKKGKTTKGITIPIHRKKADEKELWKPGAKLEPGMQLIIKKPKAKEAGDTPYSNETIHPNTMLFLEDLTANNDRQWLKLHDPDYRVALQDFTTFLEKLSEKVTEADETIPELPVKDIIFRIYRDVRFSKDQTPYKTHFSAAWSRTGRKGPYAAYYVQIQPSGSFVGGGLWQPPADQLLQLRRDIDRKPHKIKRVLTDAGIRRTFFGGIADNEKKAVKAFINQPEIKSNALKKHPKGYDADHKDIELLRLRSFTLGTKVSDEEVLGPRGLERIAEIIACMVPFISYLNSVVMPDEESSDSDENEEEGDSSDHSEDGGEEDA